MLRTSVLHVVVEEAVQGMIIMMQEEIWAMVAMRETIPKRHRLFLIAVKQ